MVAESSVSDASSRIFIKGIPPSFDEVEFRKHFSQNGREITDAKIFPNRRIGYVGYKTAEDAQKAVKYFNKTFIRMSRITVEPARPIEQLPPNASGPRRSRAPTAAAHSKDERANTDGKRKRDDDIKADQEDTKLKEFLEVMKPASQKRGLEVIGERSILPIEDTDNDHVVMKEDQSDNEYEEVPRKKAKISSHTSAMEQPHTADPKETVNELQETGKQDVEKDAGPDGASEPQPSSDTDWMRTRTSRLLGLLDDEEDTAVQTQKAAELEDDDVFESEIHQASKPETVQSMPTPPSDNDLEEETQDADVETVRSTMRLFLRNLPYNVSEEDLRMEFASFGDLEEIHVPQDLKTGKAKGFAYLQYIDPDAAENALKQKDGQTFQGRLLHVLPASAKRETKLDDFALSKLPLKKQQQIRKRREANSTAFNWNALYMNPDAVVSSVADRLGLAKSEVLDPTSSDAAIKQAHAETHIIQETKNYFKGQGVDLDAFKRSQRGDTAILVKNIPYDCSQDELRRLFETQGDIKRFLMPPSGTIAIIEFSNAAQTKSAFAALAYRKVKSSVLFLEKAPKDVFNNASSKNNDADLTNSGISKVAASDLKDAANEAVPETGGRATLFVRNLNFTTSTATLTVAFKPMEGLLSARVKTKTDPKKPGQVLSMGFGFVEFRTAKQAQAAMQAMDGYTLEGHKLQIRASHRGTEAYRQADNTKTSLGRKTKISIKNLPFEVNKNDVRALFGAYGQLRSVRVPKMGRGVRGFGFAEFTTAKEAENAMNALKDTHLLGRKLVLDFAEGDAVDAEEEIERMQQKVGAQVNKVALQKLTSGGRKKFTTQQEESEVTNYWINVHYDFTLIKFLASTKSGFLPFKKTFVRPKGVSKF